MAKRLIKVAKELNVDTVVIVDFLNRIGFEIEDKPIAKITEEMEQKLYAEFQNSVPKVIVPKMRKETPRSKGTKILGKIDISKFSKPKKKKGGNQSKPANTSPSFSDRKEDVSLNENNFNGDKKNINQIDLWKVFIEAQDLIVNTLPPFFLKEGTVIEGRPIHTAEIDLTNYIIKSNQIINKVFPGLTTNQIDYNLGIIRKPDTIKFEKNIFESIFEEAQLNYLHLYHNPAIVFYVKAEFNEKDTWNRILSDKRKEHLQRRGVTFITRDEINKINTEAFPISIENSMGAVFNTIKPSDEYKNRIRESLLTQLSKFKKISALENRVVAYVYNELIEKAELESITTNSNTKCEHLMLAIRIENHDYLYNWDMANWRRGLGIYWHGEEAYNDIICRLPKPNSEYFPIYLNPELDDKNLSILINHFQTKLGLVFGNENIKIQYKYVFEFDINRWREVLSSKIAKRNILYNSNSGIISFDFNSDKDLKEQWGFLSKIDELFWPYELRTHFFKVNYTYANPLDYFQEELKKQFPDLNIYYTQNKDKLTCAIHYKSGDIHTRTLAKEKLKTNVVPIFEESKYKIEFLESKEEFEYFPFEFKQSDIEQELEYLLLKLRGESFGVKEEKRLQILGEIKKVKFPEVHFSTEHGDNLESITSVPLYGNLKGDKDRLKRLKDTISKIYSDEANTCANPNTKKIIKNSSLAEGKDELEKFQEYIDLKEEVQSSLLGKRVNEKQLEAITKSLFAKDIFIIQGPPGTGKSTSISEIVWQHLKRNDNYRILITSETNLAVDNALDKLRSPYHNLIKPIRFGSSDKLDKEGKRFSFENIENWVKNIQPEISNTIAKEEEKEEFTENILEDWINRVSRQSGKYMYKEDYEEYLDDWKGLLLEDLEIRNIFFEQYKTHVNVVGATCSTIGERSSTRHPTRFFSDYCKVYYPGKDPYKCQGIRFNLTIQDEASKASPPEMAIPMVFSEKNIIIGDHRQLPPMVDSNEFIEDIKIVAEKSRDIDKIRKARKITDIIKRNKDLFDASHFEKLYRQIAPSLKTSLDTQFRMHSSINEAIQQFYKNDNGLKCGLDYEASNNPDINNPESRFHGINIPGFITPQHHIVWVNVSTPELKENTSRYNIGEVKTIEQVIKLLSNNEPFKTFQANWTEIEDQQLGIISFYGSQLKKLKQLRSKYSNLPMRISTVDRFQGMERNVIIVSTVRSNKLASYEGQDIAECLEQMSLGFADSPNRLNVALSRAKRLLIIVGNAEHFMAGHHGSKAEIYANVINVIKNPENPHSLFISKEELEQL